MRQFIQIIKDCHRKCGIWAMGIVLTQIAYSLESTKVLDLSPNKQTLTVNRGSFEGVNIGDRANFFIKKKIPRTKLYLVARGKAIKVFGERSIWRLTKISREEFLEKDKTLAFFHIANYEKTKEVLSIKRKKIVFQNTADVRLMKVKDREKRDQPDQIIKQDDEAYKIHKVDLENDDGHRDYTLFDNSVWKKVEPRPIYQDKSGQNLETYYIKNLQKAESRKTKQQSIYAQDYESLVENEVLKGKQPDLFTKEFFRLQQKEDFLSRHLETWSDDLSDDHLRRFVERHGELLEERRQEKSFKEKLFHELQFLYAYNIKSHKGNYQKGVDKISQAYGLGYEFYFIRLRHNLIKWSLLTEIRRSEDTYAMDNVNGEVGETGLKVSLQYYFVGNPLVIGGHQLYGQIGIRWGEAEIKNVDSYEFNNYTVTSIPSLGLGYKYKLHPRVGLNGLIMRDHLKFTKMSNERKEEGLRETVRIIDWKLAIGLSFYI